MYHAPLTVINNKPFITKKEKEERGVNYVLAITDGLTTRDTNIRHRNNHPIQHPRLIVSK